MPLLVDLALIAGLAMSAATEGDPDRGRAFYQSGETADGETIMAVLGGNVEIPAATVPCSSCHGHDGRGRPEGGAVPSDLRWSSLTKPYGVTLPSGRHYPPYNPRSLALAITAGLDPAGNTLTTTMPRYQLPRQAMADLIAYLRIIEDERDPGIADDALRIGTIVPRDRSAIAHAVTDTLRALFDEVGDGGGIYGRRLELVTLPAARTREALAAALDDADVVALVAPFTGADASDVLDIAESHRVPTIGPLTLEPGHEIVPRHHTFYLYGGIVDHAEVLVAFARARSGSTPRLAILSDDADLTGTMKARLETRDSGNVIFASLSGTDPADVALCLDSASLEHAVSAATAGWRGMVLAPAAAVDLGRLGQLDALEGRLFVAFPHPIGPAARDGLTRLATWSTARGIDADHRAVRGAALAAGRLLIDAIERSGRDLSRAELIRALEAVRDFETGVLPPLTYDANRRVGLRGAAILGLEGGMLQPIRGWVTP